MGKNVFDSVYFSAQYCCHLRRSQPFADAQNSILKILEEPPKSSVIILAADFTDSLLPTLRSRLLNIRLNNISDERMIKCLESEYRICPKNLFGALLIWRLER